MPEQRTWDPEKAKLRTNSILSEMLEPCESNTEEEDGSEEQSVQQEHEPHSKPREVFKPIEIGT